MKHSHDFKRFDDNYSACKSDLNLCYKVREWGTGEEQYFVSLQYSTSTRTIKTKNRVFLGDSIVPRVYYALFFFSFWKLSKHCYHQCRPGQGMPTYFWYNSQVYNMMFIFHSYYTMTKKFAKFNVRARAFVWFASLINHIFRENSAGWGGNKLYSVPTFVFRRLVRF